MAKKPAPDLSDINVAAEALGERSLQLIGMILQLHHKGVLEGVMERVDQFNERIRELEAALTAILNTSNTRDVGEGCGAVEWADKLAGVRRLAIRALRQKYSGE